VPRHVECLVPGMLCFGKVIAAVLVLLVAIGCSTRTEPSRPVERQATDAGIVDARAEAGAGPTVENKAVWRPTSTRIEVSSFGFWEGSTGYAKDRAELTPEQLAALERLRTMTPPEQMGADFTSYEVRVTDEDGSVARYRAAEGNVRDSDESVNAASLPTIDIETLRPFLDTIKCLRAKAVEPIPRTTTTPLDPKTADMSKAVAVPADTACTNGVFVPYGCSDSLLTFDVDAPATYEIVSGRCLEQLSLRVYTSDRTTLLAESTPGTAESCFTLRHTFEPGSYVLVFSKTNAAGCNQNGKAGDTSLRVRRVK